MSDLWNTTAVTQDGPATNAAVVTPNDDADLTVATRALKIGGTGGVVVVDMLGGQTSVPIPVGAFAIVPIRVRRVRATGTTATPIVAFW